MPPPPRSSRRSARLGGVAGERQEHVVERRPPHRDVVDADARAVSRRAASMIAPPRSATVTRTSVPSACGGSSLMPSSAAIAANAAPGASSVTSTPLAADAALELVGGALGDHAAAVDDRDPVGEPVGLVEVLRRQQHGRAVADELLDRRPTGRAASAGRGRWSARPGTAPAGARRAPPPGPAGAACRPSRSWRRGRPPRSRSKRSSSSCARACAPRAARRTAARPSRGSRRRSGCRRPPRTGRPGRSARAARAASATTSSPATRAVPASGSSSVVSTRTAVVLPAPFGPEHAEHGARRGLEVDAVERADVAERLDQAVGADRRLVRSIRMPRNALEGLGQDLSSTGKMMLSAMSETTSSRLLTLLSLLQGRRDWPGNELADRLEVSARTIRRDVERLRDARLPGRVDDRARPAATSCAPARRCRRCCSTTTRRSRSPSGCAPPRGRRSRGIEETAVRALVKLEQVLPSHLRRRVRRSRPRR